MCMPKYVALLRGISPTNPNMRNDGLCAVFESLGCKNVISVLSSGNIIFETQRKAPGLEEKIEDALQRQLDITSTTIIRSTEQLQQLVNKKPFGSLEHSPTSYLTVTFLKSQPSTKLRLPDTYPAVAVYGREVCSVIDTTATRGLSPISWLEKTCGPQITTRTWKTVERILGKMG